MASAIAGIDFNDHKSMEVETAPDYASVFAVLSGQIEVGFVVLGHDGSIDFASDRARELLGCGDRLDLDACHPKVAETTSQLIASIQSGDVRSIQQEIRFDENRETRHVALSIHPIDEENCTGYLLVVKDAENVRRMATDLRLAAQFRNTRRLYHSVVEDLKQPISAVLLHADLIRAAYPVEENGAELPRELRSLEIIRKQMSELNRTLTLLLEEIEPADTREQAFSLRDVLEDVARLIDPQASKQQVDVDLIADGHAARLNGSRQRIKQAVLNIAVNALDAMPNGGQLTLQLDVANKHALLGISDTGIGIGKDVLPHIFELHYTTKKTGTGVGLHVARDVISRHGGEIDVESSIEGEGTTFRIQLPVSASAS